MANVAGTRTRARDYRQNIKDYGFEGGTKRTLELLLEEYNATRNALNECVGIVGSLVDRFDEIVSIARNMKDKFEELKRSVPTGDEDVH